MQKKLIALAIAGAFVAPVAAHAESGNVTIYGVMDASFDVVDSGSNTAGNGGNRQNQIDSNSSRIGFKGSEDLGNGLTAVWQIESQINSTGTPVQSSATGTGFGGRNTFVGLNGKTWGTVVLGRHDTPYKLSTRSLDVFGDGIADNRSLMGQGAASFDGRQSNVLAYISPTMNGFTAAIGYVTFEDQTRTHTGTVTDKQDNAWSMMANYSNGPWYAALAYEKHNIARLAALSTTSGGFSATGNNSEEHAWKLGVGYSANNFRIGFAYETTRDNFGSNGVIGCAAGTNDCMGHNAWYLGGGYTFGNNEVKLAYTRAGDQGNTANTGADQWAIGIDHNFSKRTKVYALYTRLNNDSAAAYALQTGGASTTAISGALRNGAGSDPSAWSFGMRHSF